MLIYAERPSSREPFKVGTELSWYEVGIPPDEAVPARVAVSQEILVAGGGNVIYPGSSLSIRGAGIWLDAPSNSGVPLIWVEKRASQTFVHVDPLGQFRSIVGCKISLHKLEPMVWKTLSSNIVGMIGWEIMAEGGRVWYGTHLNTGLTPYEENESSGVSWPLEDGEKAEGPGNPNLLAWTEQPDVKVRFKKYLRGFHY